MTQRVSLSILLCTLAALTAQAQWSKQDSLRLQQLLNGEEELIINKEAVKSIHFDFKPTKDAIQGSPMISQDKPWMKFLDALPRNFGDTTQWIKPQYVRFTPYTPYTRWDEDPVNDPIITNEKELKISMVLNVNSAIKYDVREQRVILTGKNNNAIQVSVGATYTFDAEKLLYENLTTRGRAIKRNRKHANAWKSYMDYIPTLQDTVKKDTTLMMERLRKQAERLYPGVVESSDSLLLKNKVNGQNQTKESR